MSVAIRRARNVARAGCVLLATGLGIGAIAVTSSETPADASTELPTFRDCAELRAWYVRETLPHVTAWGVDGGPIELDADTAFRSAAESPAATVGNGETGTNVQEAGVDEPDIAKTMDDVVVTVKGRTLFATDISGSEPAVVGRIDLPSRDHSYELFLSGDRALVLGRGWSPIAMDLVEPRTTTDHPSLGSTSVTTVDLSDPTSPSVVDRQEFTGDLTAAREHDGTVRLVLTSAQVDLPFVYPHGRMSEQTALEHNRALVIQAGVDAWLPQVLEAGEPAERLVDCTDVRHPRQGSGLGTITVLTFDPRSPADLDTEAITADGSLVYASTDHLYVGTVTGGWMQWGGWTPSDASRRSAPASTVIHAFAVDGSTTDYVASGRVAGKVPDRWALSEYEGDLRVASTRYRSWEPLETGVTVLAQRGDALVATGEVTGMGRGEQITAVRWFGERAVVVTFRQTDPLYTLDLSDPTDPRLTGELKITGFSRYLHPIGADTVLGIGQSATRSGRSTGSQASTFDLDDTSRIDKVGLAASYSPVEEDARAFTYLPGLSVALVPLVDYDGGGSSIAVLEVRPDGTLMQRRPIHVGGWVDQPRALPITDSATTTGQRIAVIANGEVRKLVEIPEADLG